jgi:hypothetical protein
MDRGRRRTASARTSCRPVRRPPSASTGPACTATTARCTARRRVTACTRRWSSATTRTPAIPMPSRDRRSQPRRVGSLPTTRHAISHRHRHNRSCVAAPLHRCARPSTCTARSTWTSLRSRCPIRPPTRRQSVLRRCSYPVSRCSPPASGRCCSGATRTCCHSCCWPRGWRWPCGTSAGATTSRGPRPSVGRGRAAAALRRRRHLPRGAGGTPGMVSCDRRGRRRRRLPGRRGDRCAGRRGRVTATGSAWA